MNDTEKLEEIRKICLEIDTMVHNDPSKWKGSIQWVTGQIMCAAKYGPGYPNCDSASGDMTWHDGNANFPLGLARIKELKPGESVRIL